MSWTDVSTNLLSATWLKIALLLTEPQPIFNATIIAALPGPAAAGLRSDHVLPITADSFAAFTSNHSAYFTNDTTRVFTAEQLIALQDTTFGNMSALGIYGLNASIISNITLDQMQHLTVNQINAMTCDQLSSLTGTQLEKLGFSEGRAYRNVRRVALDPIRKLTKIILF